MEETQKVHKCINFGGSWVGNGWMCHGCGRVNECKLRGSQKCCPLWPHIETKINNMENEDKKLENAVMTMNASMIVYRQFGEISELVEEIQKLTKDLQQMVSEPVSKEWFEKWGLPGNSK